MRTAGHAPVPAFFRRNAGRDAGMASQRLTPRVSGCGCAAPWGIRAWLEPAFQPAWTRWKARPRAELPAPHLERPFHWSSALVRRRAAFSSTFQTRLHRRAKMPAGMRASPPERLRHVTAAEAPAPATERRLVAGRGRGIPKG